MAPRKSAILVWCGYRDENKRHGVRKDVEMVDEVLLKLGFIRENVTKLIDTPDHPRRPTAVNIQNALYSMRKDAKEGDVLFFYFSGLVNANPANNIPGIVCSDGQVILATEFEPQDNQLPKNTSFTLVLDSSHSGNFINPVELGDNRILFSACQVNETTKRVVPDEDNESAYGVFTKAIQMVLRQHPPPITNNELLRRVSADVDRYDQLPGLVCNENNRNARFLDFLGTA